MSGKIHRCNEEPAMSTVFWSDSGKKKTWMLHAAVIYEESFFTADTPITYCPYCGEKLEPVEEEKE